MPDKRDMHQAKSHRNSKSAKQQAAGAAPQRPDDAHAPGGAPVGTATPAFESGEQQNTEIRGNNSGPDNRGKRNKSGR